MDPTLAKSLSSEASLTMLIYPYGSHEVYAPETRPMCIDEDEFAVGGLPQEKPAQSLLTGGSDDQVNAGVFEV